MSEEDFLTRWSRRKREVAKEEARETPAPEAPAQPPPPVSEKPEVAFDLASLPSLESINELTDIKAFLREGVPADLTRAALRRVWTADPAIRDFVGLAENAWDFTDPNAMPGFGPLEATEEVRRLVARVISEIGQSAETAVSDADVESTDAHENSNHSKALADETRETGSVSKEQPKQIAAPALGMTAVTKVLPHGNIEDAAAQRDPAEAQEKPKQFTHRSHGGALPR